MIATAAQSSLVFASAPVRQDWLSSLLSAVPLCPDSWVSNPPSEEPDDEPPPVNIWINTKATTASSPRPPPPAATPPSPPSPPPAPPPLEPRRSCTWPVSSRAPSLNFIFGSPCLPAAPRPRWSHLRPQGTPVPPDCQLCRAACARRRWHQPDAALPGRHAARAGCPASGSRQLCAR